MSAAVKLLAYLGLALFAIGFAWYTHRVWSELGWAFFKRTFIEDKPSLMLSGLAALLLAFGLKAVSL